MFFRPLVFEQNLALRKITNRKAKFQVSHRQQCAKKSGVLLKWNKLEFLPELLEFLPGYLLELYPEELGIIPLTSGESSSFSRAKVEFFLGKEGGSFSEKFHFFKWNYFQFYWVKFHRVFF